MIVTAQLGSASAWTAHSSAVVDDADEFERSQPQRLAPSHNASASGDDGGVGAPCVVPMAGGKWRLYYSGRAKGSAPGAWCGVGLALMDDAAFAADGAAGGDGAPPGSSGGPAVAGLAGARWRRRSYPGPS